MLGTSFGAGLSGKVAFNWWPDADTERNVVVDEAGTIWKDTDGAGSAWAALASGLTVRHRLDHLDLIAVLKAQE